MGRIEECGEKRLVTERQKEIKRKRERKDIESVDDVLRQCCSIASGFGRQLSGQIQLQHHEIVHTNTVQLIYGELINLYYNIPTFYCLTFLGHTVQRQGICYQCVTEHMYFTIDYKCSMKNT